MLVGSDAYTVDTGTLVSTDPPGFTAPAGKIVGGRRGARYRPAVFASTNVLLQRLRMGINKSCQAANCPMERHRKTPEFLVEMLFLAVYFGATCAVYGDGVIVSGYPATQSFSGFSATTGAYLWTAYLPSVGFCSSTFIDGVFAFGAEDGAVIAWNITTGHLMWKWNPVTPDGYLGLELRLKLRNDLRAQPRWAFLRE